MSKRYKMLAHIDMLVADSTLLRVSRTGSENKTTAVYRAVKMKCLHTNKARLCTVELKYCYNHSLSKTTKLEKIIDRRVQRKDIAQDKKRALK